VASMVFTSRIAKVTRINGLVRVVYQYWTENLRAGGFQFSARIVSFADGRPGDVGLFFTCPESTLEA
jgi:hypothetical protein